MNIHCSVQVAVYPRWRGEHVTHFVLMDGDTGLSPLARGTHEDQFYIMAKVRFIPAGAGNTITGMRVSRQNAVYPRWRGEHRDTLSSGQPCFGLSPLARGTRIRSNRTGPRTRFIPAGAGNTGLRHRGGNVTAVYPRWRGEHSWSADRASRRAGLSPLARGTRYYAQ